MEATPKRGRTLTYMIPADTPPSLDGHREGTLPCCRPWRLQAMPSVVHTTILHRPYNACRCLDRTGLSVPRRTSFAHCC